MNGGIDQHFVYDHSWDTEQNKSPAETHQYVKPLPIPNPSPLIATKIIISLKPAPSIQGLNACLVSGKKGGGGVSRKTRILIDPDIQHSPPMLQWSVPGSYRLAGLEHSNFLDCGTIGVKW